MSKRARTKVATQSYEIVPHTFYELKLDIGIWCLTHADISYIIFDRARLSPPQFIEVRRMMVDALAQADMCVGAIKPKFFELTITGDPLNLVAVALVQVRNPEGDDHFRVRYGSYEYCPVGFIMCESRSKTNVRMHLELLCKAERVKASIGTVLLYQVLRYVTHVGNQDVELSASLDNPALVGYYAAHGFVLANQYAGCAQVTQRYLATHDAALAALGGKVASKEAVERLGTALGLSARDVVVEDEGYYMVFCRAANPHGGLQKAEQRYDAALIKPAPSITEERIAISWAKRNADAKRLQLL